MATAVESLETLPSTRSTTVSAIDRHASHASFTVRNRFAFVKHQDVTGRFAGITGTIALDERDPVAVRVALDIDAATVSTGNDRRNAHLRADDFFAVDRFPALSFLGRSVETIDAATSRFRVTGTLTIRDIERAVSVEVDYIRPNSVDPRRTARFFSTATLDRRDFGITWGNPFVRIDNDVRISVDLEATPDRTAPHR